MNEDYTSYGHIYCIKNIKNNRKYIGARLGDPVSIKTYSGGGSRIKEAINVFGIRNFNKKILAKDISTDNNLLEKLEKRFIQLFKTHVSLGGYNIMCNGGQCRKTSIVIRKKISCNDILIDPNNNAYSPININIFCKEHKILYALLTNNINKIINYNNLNRKTFKQLNTIGWMRCTLKFAKENGLLDKSFI